MGQLETTGTTEWFLVNWGRWAYVNRGLNLYYPSVEPFERMRGTASPSPSISDSEAMIIDGLVSQLRIAHKAQYEALALHYVGGKTYRQIAKIKDTHHRTVSDLVKGGVLWVDGAIHGGAPSN